MSCKVYTCLQIYTFLSISFVEALVRENITEIITQRAESSGFILPSKICRMGEM